MLGGLRNFHRSIDCLKELEKRKEVANIPPSKEQSVFNQANIDTTLGILLRDRAEHAWTFPSTTMPSRVETELKLKLNLMTHPDDLTQCKSKI